MYTYNCQKSIRERAVDQFISKENKEYLLKEVAKINGSKKITDNFDVYLNNFIRTHGKDYDSNVSEIHQFNTIDKKFWYIVQNFNRMFLNIVIKYMRSDTSDETIGQYNYVESMMIGTELRPYGHEYLNDNNVIGKNGRHYDKYHSSVMSHMEANVPYGKDEIYGTDYRHPYYNEIYDGVDFIINKKRNVLSETGMPPVKDKALENLSEPINFIGKFDIKPIIGKSVNVIESIGNSLKSSLKGNYTSDDYIQNIMRTYNESTQQYPEPLTSSLKQDNTPCFNLKEKRYDPETGHYALGSDLIDEIILPNDTRVIGESDTFTINGNEEYTDALANSMTPDERRDAARETKIARKFMNSYDSNVFPFFQNLSARNFYRKENDMDMDDILDSTFTESNNIDTRGSAAVRGNKHLPSNNKSGFRYITPYNDSSVPKNDMNDGVLYTMENHNKRDNANTHYNKEFGHKLRGYPLGSLYMNDMQTFRPSVEYQDMSNCYGPSCKTDCRNNIP